MIPSRSELQLPFGLYPQYTSGDYYGSPLSTNYNSSQNYGNLTLVSCPIVITRSVTFDQIAIYADTGLASTNVGLYIYADDGTGFPGSLITDAGTVSTATGSALKTKTISWKPLPGHYHLAMAQDSATPKMYGSIVNGAIPFVAAWLGTNSSQVTYAFFKRTAALASLAAPGTFGAGTKVLMNTTTGNVPGMQLRAA